MKRFAVFLLVLITIFSSIFFFRQNIEERLHPLVYFSYCDQPIRYKIGSVDPRFDISEDQLKNDAQEAADIWNIIESKQLFVFDPTAELTINMVYDERQYLFKQIDLKGNSLNQEKESIEPKISQFDQMTASFQKEVDDLNKQIQHWNSKGGAPAPADVYNQLIAKQSELRARYEQLQQTAQTLKHSTDTYNQEINKLNQTIKTFNNTLEIKPEEGLYDGANNRIDIYFNISQEELITTIAHEFGHAIKLEHNNDPISIMYLKVTRSMQPSITDIQSLREVCKERSRFEVIYQKFLYRVMILKSRILLLLSTVNS